MVKYKFFPKQTSFRYHFESDAVKASSPALGRGFLSKETDGESISDRLQSKFSFACTGDTN